jgi:hypothetical protein
LRSFKRARTSTEVRRIPAFDPGGYFGAILSQPSILFMEHLNHLSDESPADW